MGLLKNIPNSYYNENGFKKEKVRAILNAIFFTKEKESKITQSDKNKINSIVFHVSYPKNYKGKDSLVLYEQESQFYIPNDYKIVPSPNLIIFQELSDEYFNLISKTPEFL
ncbi:hypothetical protein [Tenacibaculum retecalamus]|uniref:hypothetical protein n=1 Tax=Tenacibaculum retecalamus TaxID=3018315 RepID=UPI0023D9551E|nr:hypothetical protein [Tenacibaculum retecalamus]WBX72011.1 hypothetical protein PG912_04365 [Tenacibaculum retecalamus]